jgi:hypothetical protein
MSDTGVMERLIVALNANTAALTGKNPGDASAAAARRPAAAAASAPAKAKPKATLEAVVAKAGQVAEAKGKEQAKRLAESFGAERSRQLKPDCWDAFIVACDAILNGDDTAAGDDDDDV